MRIRTGIALLGALLNTGSALEAQLDVPEWDKEPKLEAADGAAGDDFGYPGGVAYESGYAVIGARGDDDNGTNSGSAYVFRHNTDGTWTQEAKLLASDGAPYDRFGVAVAICGNLALVGAQAKDYETPDGLIYELAGAAYVFRRDGTGSWSQEAKLTPSDPGVGRYFGCSVAIEGNTALISTPVARHCDGTLVTGAVYAFRRDAYGNWIEEDTICSPDDDHVGRNFGEALCLADGVAVVVNEENTDNNAIGSAFVFEQNQDATWSLASELIALDAQVGHQFGQSVAAYGDWIWVGAPLDDDIAYNSGAVYVFENTGGGWIQHAKLTGSLAGDSSRFGADVGIFGNYAVVGAPGHIDPAKGQCGAFYVFRLTDTGTWIEDGVRIARDVDANSYFGSSAFRDCYNISWDAEYPTYVAHVCQMLILDIDPLDSVNEAAHHTDRYALSPEEERTILRRCETAQVNLYVRDIFDQANWHVEFAALSDYDEDGTPERIEIPYYATTIPTDEWGCRLLNFGAAVDARHLVQMEIQIPSSAPIGEYSFHAIVKDENDHHVVHQPFQRPVVILFNPYSADDAVYMPDINDRHHYLEARSQHVSYTTSAGDRRVLSWDCAQGAEDTFLGTLELLVQLDAVGRSDPAAVARFLMPRLNANDGDPGVLQGQWGGPYDGGTPPHVWTTSEQIFSEYRTSGTVSYGQCWTFAGLLSSSLRTLGIPSRLITNFKSGFEVLTPTNDWIDVFYVKVTLLWFDVWLPHPIMRDKWWGWHVWSEAWMTRADIPGASWQALDCTPVLQREQANLSNASWTNAQNGPAPVQAIHDGDVTDFDVSMFEVAVDGRIHYQKESGESIVRVDNEMGELITTHGPSSAPFGVIDITSTYKIPVFAPHPLRSEIELRLDIPAVAELGLPLAGSLRIDNSSGQQQTVNVAWLANAQMYNGDQIDVVAPPTSSQHVVPALGGVSIPISVDWSSIAPTVEPMSVIEFVGTAYCPATDVVAVTTERIAVSGVPVTLSLDPTGRVATGGVVDATFTITNPLAVDLSNVVLKISGDDGVVMNDGAYFENVDIGTIVGGASVTVTRQFVASTTGHKVILANVYADSTGMSSEVAEFEVLDCIGDIDGDGDTDQSDMGILLAHYGIDDVGDIDGDGDTDQADLALLLGDMDCGT